MTYHHFINVAALAFAPYWIFYKARISAQSETKSILMGAGFYLFAQFLELITLATFVSGGSGGQTTLNGAGSLLHIVQVMSPFVIIYSLVLNWNRLATFPILVAVTAHRTHPRCWAGGGFGGAP